MSNIIDRIKKAITSTYICIKYPFLYPRNRFTGLHYNNWKLHDYHVSNYKRAVKSVFTHIYTVDEWNRICDSKSELYETYSTGLNVNFEYDVVGEYVLLINNDDVIRTIYVNRVSNIDDIGFLCNNDHIDFYIILRNDCEKPEDTFLIDHLIDDKWIYFKIKFADFLNEYVLQIFHCIPTFTEWDALKSYKGWYNAFGEKLLKEIDQQLRKDKMRYTWRIIDIKEKYGSLQIYCNYATNELYDLLAKYERISYHTCIECGKPAKYLSSGWICPYCEDHYDPTHGYTAIADENGEWKYETDDSDKC